MLHILFISLFEQAYMLNYEQFNFLFHILEPSFFLGHIKRNRNLAIPADEREKKKGKTENKTCTTPVKGALFQKLDWLNESFSSSI
jgi:hypothetical protein